MSASFSEVKLFQVKPGCEAAFEALAARVAAEQGAQPGCRCIRYLKRFYTIDGVELGEPPRELTKVVKCVKYYAYWEFDDKESYGRATKWLFDTYAKEMFKLLIAPFDINCGDTIA